MAPAYVQDEAEHKQFCKQAVAESWSSEFAPEESDQLYVLLERARVNASQYLREE